MQARTQKYVESRKVDRVTTLKGMGSFAQTQTRVLTMYPRISKELGTERDA